MGDLMQDGDASSKLAPLAHALTSDDEAQQLVFAMCHEIGNLVAAVQLEADLLRDVDSPRALAASAVRIEDLCALVGGWLTQVRPVLSASQRIRADVDPLEIISAVKGQLDWRGSGSVTLRVDAQPKLPTVTVDPDVLRQLVLGFVLASLETGTGCSEVELVVRTHADELRFCISDDGKEDAALAQWRETASCGRALLCAVAASVLRAVDGSVAVSREQGWTRIALSLPVNS